MAGMKITIDVDTADALRWLREAQAGRGVDITDEVEDMRRRLADAEALCQARCRRVARRTYDYGHTDGSSGCARVTDEELDAWLRALLVEMQQGGQ